VGDNPPCSAGSLLWSTIIYYLSAGPKIGSVPIPYSLMILLTASAIIGTTIYIRKRRARTTTK